MGSPDCLPPSIEPGLLHCDALLDLVSIFEPHTNAVVCQRPLSAAIDAYLASPAVLQALGRGLRCRLQRGQPPQPGLLPEGSGRSALLADMILLAEVMAELLDCPAVGLRLEVLDKPMCPRFHVDRVGIRMLCTYRGAGTEYLHGSAADRSLLGAAASGGPDVSSGLIRNPAGVERLPAGAIVLLKGSAWPGNGGYGAIHRSPECAGHVLPRVLLALDAIWE